MAKCGSDNNKGSGNRSRRLVNIVEEKVFFATRISRRKSSILPHQYNWNNGSLSFICPMDNNSNVVPMTPVDNFTAFDFSVFDEGDNEIDTKKVNNKDNVF